MVLCFHPTDHSDSLTDSDTLATKGKVQTPFSRPLHHYTAALSAAGTKT